MIKINLTPIEELENPLWWVPDLLVVLSVILISFFSVQFYLDSFKTQRDLLNKEADALELKNQQLSEPVKKYDTLQAEIKQHSDELESLRRLTQSKVLRYQPVILVEHLQNLKPEGVWFEAVDFIARRPSKTESKKKANGKDKVKNNRTILPEEAIKITGYAFDNVMIAEFMTALRATQTQEIDVSDIRTHIYFSQIDLIQSSLVELSSALDDVLDESQAYDDNGILRYISIPKFELYVEYTRREVKQSSLELSFNSISDEVFALQMSDDATSFF